MCSRRQYETERYHTETPSGDDIPIVKLFLRENNHKNLTEADSMQSNGRYKSLSFIDLRGSPPFTEEDYNRNISDHINIRLAQGIKMAINTVVGKFDEILPTKVKDLVREEIDLKIKEIREALAQPQAQVQARPKPLKKNNRKKAVMNVVRQNMAEIQPPTDQQEQDQQNQHQNIQLQERNQAQIQRAFSRLNQLINHDSVMLDLENLSSVSNVYGGSFMGQSSTHFDSQIKKTGERVNSEANRSRVEQQQNRTQSRIEGIQRDIQQMRMMMQQQQQQNQQQQQQQEANKRQARVARLPHLHIKLDETPKDGDSVLQQQQQSQSNFQHSAVATDGEVSIQVSYPDPIMSSLNLRMKRGGFQTYVVPDLNPQRSPMLPVFRLRAKDQDNFGIAESSDKSVLEQPQEISINFNNVTHYSRNLLDQSQAINSNKTGNTYRRSKRSKSDDSIQNKSMKSIEQIKFPEPSIHLVGHFRQLAEAATFLSQTRLLKEEQDLIFNKYNV